MPSRGNRACTGTEVGTSFACLRNRKEGRKSQGHGDGEAGRSQRMDSLEALLGSFDFPRRVL